MYATMTKALRNGDHDNEIRIHVFLGAPEVFTAGNDLNDFMAVAMGAAKGEEVVDFLRALIEVEKPMVAGVDGLAIGLGTTMLMHCDVVCASPRAMLQTPFLDLGLVPEAGSSLVAPRIMGHQRAFALLVLGEKWSAKQACDAGLVTFETGMDDLESRTLEIAQRLADKPQQALTIARRLLRRERPEIIARMEEEGAHFAERLKSEEAKSAFMNFMSKNMKK